VRRSAYSDIIGETLVPSKSPGFARDLRIL
jgi:hypothetical protein